MERVAMLPQMVPFLPMWKRSVQVKLPVAVPSISNSAASAPWMNSISQRF